MKSLQKTQQAFFDRILSGLPESARERIYTNAYRIRFEESLKEDFPTAIRLDPRFSQHFEEFCTHHGSKSWSLNHLFMFWLEFLNNQIELDQTDDFDIRQLYLFEGFQFASVFLVSDINEKRLADFIVPPRIDFLNEFHLARTKPALFMVSTVDLEEIWKSEFIPSLSKDPKQTRIEHLQDFSNFFLYLFYRNSDGSTFIVANNETARIVHLLIQRIPVENWPVKLQSEEFVSTAFAFLGAVYTADNQD